MNDITEHTHYNMLMFEQSPGAEDMIPAISWIRRIFVSFFGVVLIAFISQLALQGWYNGKIVSGVSIGHIEIGGMTVGQARLKLNNAVLQVAPSFVVAGKRYTPKLSEIGAHYDTDKILRQAYKIGREGLAAHPRQVDLALIPVVDSDRLASYLAPISSVGNAPVDARLEVYKGVIQVIPEIPGFMINKLTLEKSLRENLTSFHPQEAVIVPEVLGATIRTPDLAQAQGEAQELMAISITLIDGTSIIKPAATDIATWLNFVADENGKMITRIDQGKVASFVAKLGKKLDHLPIDRRVTIADGATTIQSPGTDGDAIDRDPIVATLAKMTAGTAVALTITRHPLTFQTVTTNLTGIDSGRYIEINLTKQHLWAWDNHAVIYDSTLTSGAVGVGLGTVTGTFHIYYKNTNTHLVGRDYSVPVKYWMPFYLGYGLHDAVWRHGMFGGQDYIYAGSHGCVNLPDATAEWLYNWSDIGTVVWVHK